MKPEQTITPSLSQYPNLSHTMSRGQPQPSNDMDIQTSFCAGNRVRYQILITPADNSPHPLSQYPYYRMKDRHLLFSQQPSHLHGGPSTNL